MKNEIVCIDVEAADTEMFERALTFDVVNPTSATGEAGIYEVDIALNMSNGDVVEYFYNEGKPYSNGKREHYMKINSERVNANDGDDFEPLQFIRNTYRLHLIQKIKKV